MGSKWHVGGCGVSRAAPRHTASAWAGAGGRGRARARATSCASRQRLSPGMPARCRRYQDAIWPRYRMTSGSVFTLGACRRRVIGKGGCRRPREHRLGRVRGGRFGTAARQADRAAAAQRPGAKRASSRPACEHTKAAPRPFIFAFGAVSKCRKWYAGSCRANAPVPPARRPTSRLRLPNVPPAPVCGPDCSAWRRAGKARASAKPWLIKDFSRSWCRFSRAWTQPPSPAVMGLLASGSHQEGSLGPWAATTIFRVPRKR